MNVKTESIYKKRVEEYLKYGNYPEYLKNVIRKVIEHAYDVGYADGYAESKLESFNTNNEDDER